MEPLEGYVTLPPDDELVMSIQVGTCRKIRRLEVLKNGEEVIMMGTCPSFYIKQMAQESIRNKLNGLRLKNTITVKPE